MDSVTQAVLGAGVGVAVMGRRLGPRRAAVAGAVLGTLPDLDVFIPSPGPVESFVGHRGPSHSIVVQALATPLIGELLMRIFRELRDARLLAYLAIYFCLATHALLDAMTVYGTRLFWPVLEGPVAVGSVFIIDPLYTLPLLAVFVWALFLGRWTRRFGAALTVCLGLSTVYLGWSVAAQALVAQRAEAVLAGAGVRHVRMLVTPTPFNTLFWKVVAMDGDRYLNLYLPVLGGGQPSASAYPSGVALAACLSGVSAFERLAAFGRGFHRLERMPDGRIVYADLRMGMTPNYSFRFAIARQAKDGTIQPVPPERLPGVRRATGDLDWLLAALRGDVRPRPAEAGAAIALAGLRAAAAAPSPNTACG
jgi:inner membrane protein